MNVKLTMEDVHIHATTLMDLISVYVWMTMTWLVMDLTVLVSIVESIVLKDLCKLWVILSAVHKLMVFYMCMRMLVLTTMLFGLNAAVNAASSTSEQVT